MGRARLEIAAVGAWLALVAGCATDVRLFEQAVTARAPGDLACGATEVRVHRTADWDFEATGCGKRAAYRCICDYATFGQCTRPNCAVQSGPPPSSVAPSWGETSGAPAPLVDPSTR